MTIENPAAPETSRRPDVVDRPPGDRPPDHRPGEPTRKEPDVHPAPPPTDPDPGAI
jgi:hypothetical protein